MRSIAAAAHGGMTCRVLTVGAILGLVAAGSPRLASAQLDEPPTAIQWWHPIAAGAGAALLTLVDEPVRDWLQDHRSGTLDDVSDFAADFKEPSFFAVSAGGAMLLGAALDDPELAVTGLHVMSAYALSATVMIGAKWTFGRTRPSGTPDDPRDFSFFDGGENTAFPSGSAAVVFSLATTLSDAIDRTPATVLLYGGATLNAWARLNADRHWLSDVAVGALLGITSAKLVNGSWTVAGLRPPQVWLDGRGASMGYSIGL